ncbi:MAG: FAD:protein FMN transferase [Spirochaetaceae bacterium]|jgi:thiamine biosynthesis lipoprotein|nr:FAD:protein FMN transferase [Spirochaetaceae bacterium]
MFLVSIVSKRRLPACALLLVLVSPVNAIGRAEGRASQSEFALGTVCTVYLSPQDPAKTYGAIFSRLREIENHMSSAMADTDIDRINRNAGMRPVRVHGDVITVLERAAHYAELSGGAFDPTVGPLVKLWGIGTETPRLPDPEEIRAALSLINWRDMVIDRQGSTVFLRRPGMLLDVGAIAKGYAADEAAGILEGTGVRGAIIDFGGNIAAYGEKQERQGKREKQGTGGGPWRIGVQDPLDTRGAFIGILEVRNKSVVTSGVYERYADINGTRYHHILSTENGYPVDNGLLSVTVISDFSIDADALSTAVFALGYEKGAALLGSRPAAEGVFIFADKTIRLTPGAAGVFTLRDSRYRVARE